MLKTMIVGRGGNGAPQTGRGDGEHWLSVVDGRGGGSGAVVCVTFALLLGYLLLASFIG